jgi:hypothetical protein
MKYAVVYWIATNETSCFERQLCSRCQHAYKSEEERDDNILQTARGKEGPKRRVGKPIQLVLYLFMVSCCIISSSYKLLNKVQFVAMHVPLYPLYQIASILNIAIC